MLTIGGSEVVKKAVVDIKTKDFEMITDVYLEETKMILTQILLNLMMIGGITVELDLKKEKNIMITGRIYQSLKNALGTGTSIIRNY